MIFLKAFFIDFFFEILMDFLAKFCIFDEFLAIFQKIEN